MNAIDADTVIVNFVALGCAIGVFGMVFLLVVTTCSKWVGKGK